MHDLGGEGTCLRIKGHQHYPDQTHTDPGPYWNWNYYYKLINNGTLPVSLGGPGVSEGDLNHLNYGNDERKIWVIRGDQGKQISLNFSSFNLEANYDFLWIYDGDNVFAPLLGRWNTMSPGTVVSSGNALCVEFRSDCLTTAEGWRAHWTVDSPAQVDTILLGSETCFGIYPNPVGDALTIRLQEEGFHDIRISDITGRTVWSCRLLEDATIDVSQWPRGVYVVSDRRVGNGEVVLKRFIR